MKKVVSFDFDGTLTRIRFDDSLGLWINSAIANPKMIRLLKRLHAKGYEVHIVTRRFSHLEESLGPTEETNIADFLAAHGLTDCAAAVHFCGDADPSGDKTETLRRIGSLRHWDDSQEFLDQAARAGVRGRKV